MGHAPEGTPRTPAESDFFSVADTEYSASVGSPSYGDLWPSTWADDDALYAACGDGFGFSDGPWSDIVVSRIDGDPTAGLTGERLASGRDVAPVWSDPRRFNSKPTGMLAVDGNADGRDELYLAVQDLRCGPGADVFDTAPAAGIVRSDDYGRTWSAGRGEMFTDLFTTVMFCDFGKSHTGAVALRELVDGEHDPARYVYAFGLDHNWRTSHSSVVPDPTELFLARAPVDSIQDRRRWTFYSGGAVRNPQWSPEIAAKVAVLTDERRRYPAELAQPGVPAPGGTVVGQGGVVYNAPLRRFIYTSWAEYTFEFYEAPAPWGPWRHFLSHDFGPHPWSGPKAPLARHGGYAPTIPSKFISADGRDAYVQSNWFGGAPTYTGNTYHFSLRRLRLDPAPSPTVGSDAADRLQPADGANLATAAGARPVASSCRSGQIQVLHDGDTARAEDSWNGLLDHDHYWGYQWPGAQWIDRLVYTSGPTDCTGGWFARVPQVQVRRGGVWIQVPEVEVTPRYPCDDTATGQRTYTFTFPTRAATGVRIIGPAGGWSEYTAVAELAVYGPPGTGSAPRPSGWAQDPAGADPTREDADEQH